MTLDWTKQLIGLIPKIKEASLTSHHNMKKIVICFWDIGIGGIGSRIRDLLIKLEKYPQIEVVCLLKKPSPEHQKHIVSSKTKFYYFQTDNKVGNQAQFLLWLLLKISQEKPTHLLGFLNRFGLVLALAKINALFQQRSLRTILDQPIGTIKYLNQFENSFIWKPLFVISLKLIDYVRVPTKANKRELVRYFGVDGKKVRVIPSSIEIVNTLKQEKRSINKKYDAIFVGRLSKEKGLETLIETITFCASKMSHFKIAVLGDGELKNWFKNELESKNLLQNVDYLGYRTNVRSYLRKSSLLLLPTYNEGLPMVFLEAYAEGIPVIATPYEGVEEVVIHNKTGIISARSSFAKTVFGAIKNKEKTAILGENAKVFVSKKFSDRNVSRLIKYIFQN